MLSVLFAPGRQAKTFLVRDFFQENLTMFVAQRNGCSSTTFIFYWHLQPQDLTSATWKLTLLKKETAEVVFLKIHRFSTFETKKSFQAT